MEHVILDLLKVTEIRERVVAIVRFGPAGLKTDGFRPGEYYQVTVDPDRLSPSGEFIRFGTYPGDEIVGWQRCEAISVVEILAEWPSEQETPQLSYGQFEGVTVMAAKQPVEAR